MVDITTLTVSDSIMSSVKLIANNELDMVWNEEVVARFEVL